MPELDWDRIRKEKDAYRDSAASLPFEEKLQVMERLRDRALAMREHTGPAPRGHGEPASNIHVVVPHPQRDAENVRSVMNLGLFGVTATLAAAMVSRQSVSASPVAATGKSVDRA